MLKCPICGKEYSYESKICKDCEDYLKYSDLAKSVKETGYKGDSSYKWNCAAFLEDDNYIFTIRRRPKIYPKLTSEPLNLRIAPERHHEWNTESATRFRSCIEKSLVESKITSDSELIDDIIKLIARKYNYLLIYE